MFLNIFISICINLGNPTPLPHDSLAIQQPETIRKVNFFVVAKRRKGRFDIATRYSGLRARVHGIFHPKTFKALFPSSPYDMAAQIERTLRKKNALVGVVWYDSHGYFERGRSLFIIGRTEYNATNILDSLYLSPLMAISKYFGPNSKLVIGSCYAGAGYNRRINQYRDMVAMKGDSLLYKLANIFPVTDIYGSQSWVMTKPGLFHKKPATAGFPLRKKYLDTYFTPVWGHVGEWSKYGYKNKTIETVNPVSLTSQGNIYIAAEPYLKKNRRAKKVKKREKKIRPGLFNC